ncbi:MAG: hypothetical protein U1F43_09475 [Myxococcota bacterium]
MNLASLILELAVLGFGIVCGAMVYEHTAIVPVWAARPPESLHMWQGPHRVRAERFWMPSHPMVVLLLAVALALHWGASAVATRLVVVLASYVVILVITGRLFVPELMRLCRDPNAPLAPDVWRRRARRWERLSLLRGAVMLGLAVVLCDALRLA